MVPNFSEVQRFWEEVMRLQREFMETLSSMLKLVSSFSILNRDFSVFRAKVQAGGRISIPEAEKIALGIRDGDVVKVILIRENEGERYGDEGVDGSG